MFYNIARYLYRKGCRYRVRHALLSLFFPSYIFFFSFCSFYWNSLYQLSDATLLFAFTLKWRTRQACVSLLLRQSSINDLGRKRHQARLCTPSILITLFLSNRRTSATNVVVVYYLHKTIIISRGTICLFFVIYCHHCGMNRCRACLHVSSRAHAAETSRYWCATDIICTNFNRLQTCTRYARPICRYIETRFYHKVLIRLWYMRECSDYFLISVYIIIAFNLAVGIYACTCVYA